MNEPKPVAPSVATLNDLLRYQEGAVVSRTVLKAGAGNVTLFAFDSGEGLSEHTAPFDAMVLITDGQAEVSIDGSPYSVGVGETITLPANHPHALKAITPFKMLLIMIRAERE